MKKELQKTIAHLKKGHVILCPTDTIWGLSCDATNTEAVERIYRIKKRDKSKSLIVLVSSIEMLSKYVEKLPTDLNKILNTFDKALTIIYPRALNLTKNVCAQDSSIALRIVKHGFAHQLIAQFGKPIVSTSANYSNEATATEYNEINDALKRDVNYVVDKSFGNSTAKSSTIIKLLESGYITLRT